MKAIYDVVVIGGGPAGSAAAIFLARCGLDIALLEASRFPRQKVCGEFVSSESLDILEELLPPSAAKQCLSISRGRLFHNRWITTTKIDPPALSIPRIDLDLQLWSAAQAAGVECFDECPALQVQPGENATILLDRGHRIQSRIVVNATGRWSRLHASSTGNHSSTKNSRSIGLKAHYSEHDPHPSVDLYFFDGGYCGVQPVSASEVNVCAMVSSERARNLDAVFQLHPSLLERSRQWRLASDPITTSPLIFRPTNPVQNAVFHVGDAAGFIDPFAGDGISLALHSGKLAAKIISSCLSGDFSPTEALNRYQAEYHRRFDGIFRSAGHFRTILELPSPLRSAAFSLLRVPALANYVVRKTRGRVPHAA